MAVFMLETDHLSGTELRQRTVVRLIIYFYINTTQANRRIIRADEKYHGARQTTLMVRL